MVMIHLVRHGSHGTLDSVLTGRDDRVGLSPQGLVEVEVLARRLAREEVDRIEASPLRRTLETAEILAGALRRPLQPCAALLEVDFGRWAGRRYDELDQDPDWRRWNHWRSGVRCPGGESMGEVQQRVVARLQALQRDHPDGAVLLVSHGDVIRAALTWALGLSLDLLLRLEVAPASLSSVELTPWGPRIHRLNERAA
jgi:probable phosphoglycerate mutase